jgi:ABC-2 type transporter
VWVFITLELLTGNVQAAGGIGFLVLPLSFASSAYVPVESMPGWLRGFAGHQPVTVTIDAVRALSGGRPAGGSVGGALLWARRHRRGLRDGFGHPFPAAGLTGSPADLTAGAGRTGRLDLQGGVLDAEVVLQRLAGRGEHRPHLCPRVQGQVRGGDLHARGQRPDM